MQLVKYSQNRLINITCFKLIPCLQDLKWTSCLCPLQITNLRYMHLSQSNLALTLICIIIKSRQKNQKWWPIKSLSSLLRLIKGSQIYSGWVSKGHRTKWRSACVDSLHPRGDFVIVLTEDDTIVDLYQDVDCLPFSIKKTKNQI